MSEDSWIDSPGGRLFARRWQPESYQQGAPLLLLHDSLGCVELWRDFPERLAQTTGRTVIAYDRLGFGHSDRHPGRLGFDFIAAEAQQGFAAICQHFALERCQALITLAAQTLVEPCTLAGIRAAARTFAQPGQLERLQRYHGDKAAWVLDAWVDTWLADEFRDWSLDETLPKVRCPLLAIHGEHDEYGSQLNPERFATLAAGPSQMLILPGCGHVPQREHPEQVLQAVARFLSR